MLCNIKLKSCFSPCVPTFNSQVTQISNNRSISTSFLCAGKVFHFIYLSVYAYMYEHTYVWFSLKAAYKLSLSVGKIVILLFSWNIPG